MKFIVELDTETSEPDAIGECLRNIFFVEEYDYIGVGSGFCNFKYRQLGCYRTFEVKQEVQELPKRGAWFCYLHPNGIEMRYFWDGDGYLAFIFPDGRVLINSDCKCTYGWEWQDFWDSSMDEMADELP
jgi:hypothetical protein